MRLATTQTDLLISGLILQTTRVQRTRESSKNLDKTVGLANDATTITSDSEEPVTSAIWDNHTNRTTDNLYQCNNNGANSRHQCNQWWAETRFKYKTSCKSKFWTSVNNNSLHCDLSKNINYNIHIYNIYCFPFIHFIQVFTTFWSIIITYLN